jgi:hypothetical protein
MGTDQLLVTRGYGKVLVIIITPTPPSIGGGPGVVYEPYYGPLIPGAKDYIQTRTIYLTKQDKEITVDVLLVSGSAEIDVAAMLESDKYDYDHIEVYMSEEVEIHDEN